MKNKIISVIFLLLIVLLFIAMFNGIKIGNFQILPISELKVKNDKLNNTIASASELTSVTYPKTITNLEETYEKYNVQKQKYEEVSGFTEGEEKQIYETKKYDIGYLWKLVGKYATSYNIAIGMDVKKTSGQNLYDLYFNVSGQYVNISEFIKNIENNSDLYFRIYNFKMSGSSNTVSASFVVKDVNIDPSTITSSTSLQNNSTSLQNNSTSLSDTNSNNNNTTSTSSTTGNNAQ